MTPKQIGERLLAITNSIVEKFGDQPYLPITLDITDQGEVRVNLWRDRNGGDYGLGAYIGDSYDGALSDAEAFLAELPSREETQKMDFQKDLAKLIDKGSEIGIDVEFMNPLTATMKALSENIITDQRAK